MARSNRLNHRRRPRADVAPAPPATAIAVTKPPADQGAYPADDGGNAERSSLVGREAEVLAERLDHLTELLGRLDQRLAQDMPAANAVDLTAMRDAVELAERAAEGRATAEAEVARLSEETESLRDQIELLKDRLDGAIGDHHELRQQNEDLAAQLAQANIRQTVTDNCGVDDTLSWEERKALIFAQMEAETFDAGEFVSGLPATKATRAAQLERDVTEDRITPAQFVTDLMQEFERAEETILRRDSELAELRMLLQHQADSRQSGVVMGAAAIAGMLDSDELVQQERVRLQELKTEWEDKFRQAEIAASLERAKLSRERQELARRAAELEEKLDEWQREKRDQDRRAKSEDVGGRRWLAELGLDRTTEK